jgi:formiminoglutamase
VAYVRAHGALHIRDPVDGPPAAEAIHAAERPTVVSFDMDAVDRAYAPGVSAPAVDGLAVGTWLRAAYAAGRDPAVRGVDVVEVSPPHDPTGSTAALAALTVWHVLRGVAARAGG